MVGPVPSEAGRGSGAVWFLPPSLILDPVCSVSDASASVLGMEQNTNNPEARDDHDWLDLMDRLGVDPQAAMEQSLATPDTTAPLPEWAE